MDVISAGRLLVLAVATLVMGLVNGLVMLGQFRPGAALVRCLLSVVASAGLLFWAAMDVIVIVVVLAVIYLIA